jgi:hypothetical protein
MIVEKHAMGVVALATIQRHRNHLPTFRVVAESGRIRHPDEFVFDERFFDLERLRHQGAQPLRIGPVGDDQVFAVDEAIRPRWIGGRRQRHRESAFTHFAFFQVLLLVAKRPWSTGSNCVLEEIIARFPQSTGIVWKVSFG